MTWGPLKSHVKASNSGFYHILPLIYVHLYIYVIFSVSDLLINSDCFFWHRIQTWESCGGIMHKVRGDINRKQPSGWLKYEWSQAICEWLLGITCELSRMSNNDVNWHELIIKYCYGDSYSHLTFTITWLKQCMHSSILHENHVIPSNDIANVSTQKTTSRGSRCAGSIGQRCHWYSAQSHGLFKHSEALHHSVSLPCIRELPLASLLGKYSILHMNSGLVNKAYTTTMNCKGL